MVTRKRPTDFLFGQPEGGSRSSTFLYERVKRLCREAGVPEVCPHGLRGTHATLAEDAGESSFAVAVTLGHADTRVTGRHYTRRDAREGARQSRFLEVLEGGKKLSRPGSTVGSQPLIQGETGQKSTTTRAGYEI
jgi:integrase